MKKLMIAAAVLALASASPAFADNHHGNFSGSFNSAGVVGVSSTGGSQDNGAESGPGAGLAVAGSEQWSSVNNGAQASAGYGGAQGSSWANGQAGGLSGSMSLGNADGYGEGGSGYQADQAFEADSSRFRLNGGHH